MPTDNSIAMDLEEFKRTTKPDSDRSLHRFRDAIIDLYLTDYTLATIFRFVEQGGYGGSRATFYRWVKKHIDFEKERDFLRFKKERPGLQQEALAQAESAQLSTISEASEETGQTDSGEGFAKNKGMLASTPDNDPSVLERPSKRDPRAIMQSILGPSIEDQLNEI